MPQPDWPVIVRAELADLLRAPIPGIEMRFGERPAVIGQTIARLEINRVERQAPAAPMVGRAAEIAQPR